MTDEETDALAALGAKLDALSEGLRIYERANAAIIAQHASELRALNDRARRTSTRVQAAHQSTSEVGNEHAQDMAAVMMQFAKVEEGARQTQAKVEALQAQVAGVAKDTQGQNVELAVQTDALAHQSTTLEKFRRTPMLTTAAGIVGTGAGAAIWEVLSHWLKATGH